MNRNFMVLCLYGSCHKINLQEAQGKSQVIKEVKPRDDQYKLWHYQVSY